MVLRKISIDNSVKYVPITEKDIEQNTIKNKKQSKKIQSVSGEGDQNKNCSKNNKRIFEKCCSKWIFYTYKIVFV